jgi:hypothetical protein
MSVATITIVGRSFLAESVKAQTLHIGWGSGDPAWDGMADSALPGLTEATALVNELGRRAPATVGYVLPDKVGAISIAVGQDNQGSITYKRYTQVSQPTAWLYFRCNFDNADAANSVIREAALFGGTVVKPELPPGLGYLTPDQLLDPGRMIAVEIVRPCFLRSPSVRESYEFVFPM